MDVFERCRVANSVLELGRESEARDEVIKLLADMKAAGHPPTPLVNHLVRSVGLFPYLDQGCASWQERLVCELFKADVGEREPVVLHREQYRLLTALLAGKDIAVSAPTSFGKSFVIDSFISITRPKSVVILVPTIALADETRRRLHRKFGRTYSIITTSEQKLHEQNIFVFPQERYFSYASIIKAVDILIIDEFYKASKQYDKDRAPALIRAILELSKKASQRYYLAPNISKLNESEFTKGMEFMRLDFNTVYLEKHELFHQIGKDELKKSEVLLRILENNPGKTLIYAGSHSNTRTLSTLLIESQKKSKSALLLSFRDWLSRHYSPNWNLTSLCARGIGIHNGQLHRSLTQIQVHLFDHDDGIERMVSTSSIIEGVNTSAENVILWSNRNGNAKINDFTYKNIIGRSGRMFHHFVGQVFILEEPPKEEEAQLALEFPEDLVGLIEEESYELSDALRQKDAEYTQKLGKYLSEDDVKFLRSPGTINSSKSSLVLEIAREVSQKEKWETLKNLNSSDPEHWSSALYKVMKLSPGGWDGPYKRYVEFVKILSNNWSHTIPQLIDSLNLHDVSIEDFFSLERTTTYKLPSLLGDISTIYNRIHRETPIDLSLAISRFSHAFLPVPVYQLEEFGLPRMISRRVHAQGLIDLEDRNLDVQDVIEIFRNLGLSTIKKNIGNLDEFDVFILEHFFTGVVYDTQQH